MKRAGGDDTGSRTIVKHKFTPSEDMRLHELVTQNGTASWKTIARYMPNRSSRQCRERWKYYLATGATQQDTWTQEEDNLLMEKHAEIGPKWAMLVPFFSNRTDINLKNRFHRLKRCQVRQKQIETPTTSSEDDETKTSSRNFVELPAPIHMLPIDV